MTDLPVHEGSCHCGKVRFRARATIDRGSTCNCSICSRVGWIMLSIPAEQFELVAGEGAQTDYQFGSKTMHHTFCTTCGVRAFGTYAGEGGAEMRLLNLRCIPGLELKSLPIKEWDGASF